MLSKSSEFEGLSFASTSERYGIIPTCGLSGSDCLDATDPEAPGPGSTGQAEDRVAGMVIHAS